MRVLPTKVCLVKAMVFPVVMYGCESWTIKKAEHQRIDAFELWCWKRLLRVLDCQEFQPVHPKGDRSWVFIGRTDAEAETSIFSPTYAKSWLIGKESDAGRDWGQEEKGMTEVEMAGWHHRLNGHEFGWTLGVGDGQRGLACFDSWGHRVGHNWVTELNWRNIQKLELGRGPLEEKWNISQGQKSRLKQMGKHHLFLEQLKVIKMFVLSRLLSKF